MIVLNLSKKLQLRGGFYTMKNNKLTKLLCLFLILFTAIFVVVSPEIVLFTGFADENTYLELCSLRVEILSAFATTINELFSSLILV